MKFSNKFQDRLCKLRADGGAGVYECDYAVGNGADAPMELALGDDAGWVCYAQKHSVKNLRNWVNRYNRGLLCHDQGRVRGCEVVSRGKRFPSICLFFSISAAGAFIISNNLRIPRVYQDMSYAKCAEMLGLNAFRPLRLGVRLYFRVNRTLDAA